MPRTNVVESSIEAIEEDTPLDKQLDNFFKPLMLEVVTFMSKLIACVVVAACLVIGVSTANAEIEQQKVDAVDVITMEGDVVSAHIVEDTPWWSKLKDTGTDVWTTAKEKASDLSDGVFNPDKKNQMLQKTIKEQNRQIAELQAALISKTLTLGVRHESIALCLDDAATYLRELKDKQEK